MQDGTSQGVAVFDVAAKVDWLSASAGLSDLGGPPLVLRGGGSPGDVSERQQ
ncbi:hypothetical protein GCM10027176_31330 [Actinoallomurus bryophytorum]